MSPRSAAVHTAAGPGAASGPAGGPHAALLSLKVRRWFSEYRGIPVSGRETPHGYYSVTDRGPVGNRAAAGIEPAIACSASVSGASSIPLGTSLDWFPFRSVAPLGTSLDWFPFRSVAG